MPVQRNISFPDSSWKQPPSVTDQFLTAVDDSIASALGDRGLRNTWTFAREISATARRNTGMLPDPHALAVAGLRRLVKASDDPLSEPLASQIRSLISMRDALRNPAGYGRIREHLGRNPRDSSRRPRRCADSAHPVVGCSDERRVAGSFLRYGRRHRAAFRRPGGGTLAWRRFESSTFPIFISEGPRCRRRSKRSKR